MGIDEIRETIDSLGKCDVTKWSALDQLQLYQAQVLFAEAVKPLVDKYTGKPTINFNGLFQI